MEAKAAVEECYRRRARRAGLEETLPKDRPMTEQEINELSERLGDGKGSRAKRAREIEEMNIEDMDRDTRDQRHDQKEEEVRYGTTPDAASAAYVPGGDAGGWVHCVRLF
jgi:hypothetical protein